MRIRGRVQADVVSSVAAVVAIAAAVAVVVVLTRSANDTGGPAATGNGRPSKTPTMGAQIIGLDGVPIQQLSGSFHDAYGLQRSPLSAALTYSRGVAGSGSDGIATVIVAANGSAERLVGRSADGGDGHAGTSWSPDGSRIVYSWNGDIYVMNADGTGRRRLTNAAAGQGNYRPVWSPNGDLIVYWGGSNAGRDGRVPDGEIYTIAVSGGTPTRLTSDHVSDLEPTWSPTGANIAYLHAGELWIMGTDGGGKVQIARSGTGARAPAWSPDGAMIAFLRFSGNHAADGRPVMDVNVLTLGTGDVSSTGARVLTDGNGPQWVSDSALLINRYG